MMRRPEPRPEEDGERRSVALRARAKGGGPRHSGQVHLLEHSGEPGVLTEAREEERALDAVDTAGPLLDRPLEPVDRPVVLSEAGSGHQT
jgi:hypothetical protein